MEVLQWPFLQAPHCDCPRSVEEAHLKNREADTLLPTIEEQEGEEIQDHNICAVVFSQGCVGSQRWCFSGASTPTLQPPRPYGLGRDVLRRSSSCSRAVAPEDIQGEVVIQPRKVTVPSSVMVHPAAEIGTGAYVGCKVLPICDLGSARSECSSGRRSTDSPREDHRRVRTVARMRELWKKAAATSKIPKGAAIAMGWKVSHLLMNGGGKSRTHSPAPTPSSDAMSVASSKISFRWEVGSNGSGESSSVYSLPCATTPSFRRSCDASRRVSASVESDNPVRTTGHWITSDSEYLVLEL